MPAYELQLKSDNQRPLRRFFWFLFFLQVTAAAIVIAFNDDRKAVNSALTCFIIYILFLLFYFLLRKKRWALENNNVVLLAVYALFWFLEAGILAAVICMAILTFTFFLQASRNRVVINEEGVLITAAISKRKYTWPQVDNLILKDHLLTIDLKNNHVLQNEISPESYGVEEEEFNAFCSRLIITNY